MIRKQFFLVGLILSLFTLVTCTSCVSLNVIPNNYSSTAHQSSDLLELGAGDDSGTCTGTEVYEHTLFSASHCFTHNITPFGVGGRLTQIVKIINDGNDHSLVVVDITFNHLAKFGTIPIQGDSVHYWGNPAGFRDLYRVGYVTGVGPDRSTLYDLNGFFGDSGSGIFDRNNKLIGVVSFIWAAPSFKLMGSYPMRFTLFQLFDAGVDLSDGQAVKFLTGH